MEALWYYVKCAPANLIVNSWFNPSGFEHPSHQRCIDEDWLIHVPNRALLMFAAAHGRLDVLKKLERRRDGRSFMMLGAPALLDSPLFSCGVQARAFGTAVTHAAVAGAQEGSHFARMFAADTQAFLDLQHLFLRPAIRHGQMAVVNWVDKTLLDMGERYRRGFNEDRVTFCGVHIIGSWPHSNRWTCDRACVRALVADAACAGAVEPFAEAFDQIFALWHAGVEWAGAFFWSMMMWILTSGFGRGKLIKYIVRRCEIEAVAISQMLALPTIATTGLDLEHFVGTIPQGVPNRDMHLRDQAVQSMTFPGDAEYTEWLFYELCDRPDRGFLTSTARARRWSQKHTNWITNEETVVTCRHLAILAYGRCPPCLRLSGAPHRKENLSAPFLGENGEHTEDPMAFAYVAALWERPSADAPSRLEGGAVVVAERWLRCELESDTGIRSCNQWRSLLHRLGMGRAAAAGTRVQGVRALDARAQAYNRGLAYSVLLQKRYTARTGAHGARVHGHVERDHTRAHPHGAAQRALLCGRRVAHHRGGRRRRLPALLGDATRTRVSRRVDPASRLNLDKDTRTHAPLGPALSSTSDGGRRRGAVAVSLAFRNVGVGVARLGSLYGSSDRLSDALELLGVCRILGGPRQTCGNRRRA